MSDLAIKVEKLSKEYKIGLARERHDTLRDALTSAMYAPFRVVASMFNGRLPSQSAERLASSARQQSPDGYVWALKDVSFEVKQGEVLGIIGRNGAGKSTVLKILSRITEPTSGRAKIHGRVGSLLEVGTGFHGELTGRENIYLNGAILGMKKAEIDRKFDEIVAFSGIEKFIETPVKRYSSGMYVRLAFAVAAHLEPEILIVDEVLSVGDTAFQKKCLGKIGDVVKEGRTVIFVSHDMVSIERLCKRVLFLDGGELVCDGDPQQVINHYLETVIPSSARGIPLAERKERTGNGRIRLTSVHIEDLEGNKLRAVRSGMDIVFVLGFRCRDGDDPKKVDVGLGVTSSDDRILFVLYGSYTGQVFETIPSFGTFRCNIPKLPLSPGRYLLHARVTVGEEEADWPTDGVGYLEVEAGDFYGTGSRGLNRTDHGGWDAMSFLVTGSWVVTRQGDRV